MLKRFAVVAAVVTALMAVGFGGVASAQTGYPAGPTITISPTTIPPCGTGTITGSGFPPNTAGTVTVGGVSYPVTSDANGNWSVTITVPCDAVPGSTLTVTAAFAGVSVTGSILVGSGSGSSGALPVTGSGDTTALLARAGVLLVLAGGAVLFVSMSRRKKVTHAA